MITKSVARKHHYVPQSYLTGFTESGTKDSEFHVLDVETGHAFKTAPLNVGARRDFNRVDVDGHPPDAIEKVLAPIEGNAAAAIRKVIATQAFPSDGDWNLILNMISLLAVRNPKMRSSFNQAREQVLRNISELLVSDENIWNHHNTSDQETADGCSDAVSFEQAKRFVEEGRYKIEFYPEGNLRTELKALDEILPLLGQRTWSLLVAPEGVPEFICSDHPVTITWKPGHSGPIGFGLRDTEVFMPLGRRVGFYGVYETPRKPVFSCEAGHVASMNRRTARNAERHIYSALNSFYIWEDGDVREVQCEVKKGHK
jgi:hypothetical protein